MLTKRHDIESYIHDVTLQDLIVANWLIVTGIVKHGEDVTSLTISAPDDKGVRAIRYTIEPDVQIIHHES